MPAREVGIVGGSYQGSNPAVYDGFRGFKPFRRMPSPLFVIGPIPLAENSPEELRFPSKAKARRRIASEAVAMSPVSGETQ